MAASGARPHSWYGVQPSPTYRVSSELPPLVPGAPDYPPTFARPPRTTEAASPSRHQQQGEAQAGQYALQRQPYANGDAQIPTQSSPTWYQSPHCPQDTTPRAAVDTPLRRAGHQSTQSQPNSIADFYSMSNGSTSLSSPLDTTPVRPKSPRLGDLQQRASSQPEHYWSAPSEPSLGHQHRVNPTGAPPITRVHSPQPRRNTMPTSSPILANEASLKSPPSTNVRQASLPGRRPLPPPPSGAIQQQQQPQVQMSGPSPSSYAPSPSISPSPSPDLSRSPSVASTASTSSTGSMRRRPLPQPPGLPTVHDGAYAGASSQRPQSSHDANSSRRPASYAEAQAAVANVPSRESPVFNNPYIQQLPETEEPEHVREMRQRVKAMSMRAQKSASREGSDARQENSSASSRGKKAAGPAIPAISVPTFAFDEPDGEPSSSAPAISIAVAPPSPSLKATSTEYFETQLEDEGVPLPSSSVPMATTTKANALACPRCHRPVLYGRTVNAMGKRWHPDCFVCEQCETKLEHMEVFTKDGKPYCHVDYHELFSIRCNHCQTPIVDESYITIDDDDLGKRTYHELHFFCANCGDPFIDPKDHAAKASSDAELLAKPFTVHKGYPYCEACNLKLHRPKCSSCKKPIPGDVLKALNKDWCEDCFVCQNCGRSFDDGTFVTHNGLPHCELCLKRILTAANM